MFWARRRQNLQLDLVVDPLVVPSLFHRRGGQVQVILALGFNGRCAGTQGSGAGLDRVGCVTGHDAVRLAGGLSLFGLLLFGILGFLLFLVAWVALCGRAVELGVNAGHRGLLLVVHGRGVKAGGLAKCREIRLFFFSSFFSSAIAACPFAAWAAIEVLVVVSAPSETTEISPSVVS